MNRVFCIPKRQCKNTKTTKTRCHNRNNRYVFASIRPRNENRTILCVKKSDTGKKQEKHQNRLQGDVIKKKKQTKRIY